MIDCSNTGVRLFFRDGTVGRGGLCVVEVGGVPTTEWKEPKVKVEGRF